MTVIEAVRSADAVDELLLAGTEKWDSIGAVQVSLEPTPLDVQPSAYVQTSWRGRERGKIASVEVKAQIADDVLALHLMWQQDDPRRTIDDYNMFADACAVLFPANGSTAAIETMGSEEAPVCGWYWRAGTELPFEITAHGIGTVDRSDVHEVRAASWWADGRWHVVLARKLAAGATPDLANATEIPVAFAVWGGACGERAGLKSHSPEFARLRLAQ